MKSFSRQADFEHFSVNVSSSRDAGRLTGTWTLRFFSEDEASSIELTTQDLIWFVQFLGGAVKLAPERLREEFGDSGYDGYFGPGELEDGLLVVALEPRNETADRAELVLEFEQVVALEEFFARILWGDSVKGDGIGDPGLVETEQLWRDFRGTLPMRDR